MKRGKNRSAERIRCTAAIDKSREGSIQSDPLESRNKAVEKFVRLGVKCRRVGGGDLSGLPMEVNARPTNFSRQRLDFQYADNRKGMPNGGARLPQEIKETQRLVRGCDQETRRHT